MNNQTITSRLFASEDLSSCVIGAKGDLYLLQGISAIETTVLEGGEMTLMQSSFAGNTTLEDGGTFVVMSGATANSNTFNGGKVFIHGEANDTVVFGGEVFLNGGSICGTSIEGGKCRIYMSGQASGTVIEGSGKLDVVDGKAEENYVFAGGTLNVAGGDVINTLLGANAVLTLYAGTVSDVETESCSGDDTGSLAIYGGVMTDAVIDAQNTLNVMGGSVTDITVRSGGTIVLSSHEDYDDLGDQITVTGTLGDVTVLEGGIVLLRDQATFTGNFALADGAELAFMVEGLAEDAPSIVSDYSLMANAENAVHIMTVGSGQDTGTYRLADNASSFSGSFTVRTADGILGTLSLDAPLRSETTGMLYSLGLDDGSLTLTISADEAPVFNAVTDISRQLISIECPSNDGLLRIANESGALSIGLESERVRVWNLPSGDYSVSVSNCSNTLDYTASNTVSLKLASDSNDGLDVFFAKADMTWTSNFYAMHDGSKDPAMDGLGMLVPLFGKNRICDLFAGSEASSVLYLTDSLNGDAMFIDDVFSALPEGEKLQARLANIDKIFAGVGDDIVDLTSQQFKLAGNEMEIHGGAGDDVIWANHGANWLFGDEGDDSIVGASGADVIVGGNGDDILHGGGGDDIFCFCSGWGRDTVTQLDGGKVTLWFAEGDESNWNAKTMTYTDGDNSVAVFGVADVVLAFGDNNGDARHDGLLAAGAFNPFTSDRIFKESGIPALASLT